MSAAQQSRATHLERTGEVAAMALKVPAGVELGECGLEAEGAATPRAGEVVLLDELTPSDALFDALLAPLLSIAEEGVRGEVVIAPPYCRGCVKCRYRTGPTC